MSLTAASTTAAIGTTAALPPAQPRVLAAAGLGIAALAMAAGAVGGWRVGLGALIGALAGVGLYHAAFGFASSWRRFLNEGRAAGLRAQALLLSLIIAAAYPLLALGGSLGLTVNGWVFPFGLGAAFGATLFGIGMQLAGGCGSGTLYTVGGGSVRMLVALAAFIVGSLAATAHVPLFEALPSLPAISVIDRFGWPLALLASLGVIGGLAAAVTLVERRRHGAIEVEAPGGFRLRGPWSKTQGAVVLAVVAVLTLIVIERPWGITAAFALWGAKAALAVGLPVDQLEYWQRDAASLAAPVLADPTSVMDLGLMLGALAAAGAAGRFAPRLALTRVDLLTAIAGGLLMGYGARLSYGCNIGAFLGGITSASLHGWLWLPFAFAGTMIGTALRRRLGM